MALWSLAMAVVLALKVPEVDPAATVIEVGALKTELVFDSVTVAPPVGATLVKVTVQVLEAFGPRAVGLQAREETRTAAVRLMVALAELLL